MVKVTSRKSKNTGFMKHFGVNLSRCDISLSMQFNNNGFYNPDPPRKKNNKIPAPLAPKLIESILL